MSTPNKKSRKPSTNSDLSSTDRDLITKIVSNLEKYLKQKNEENAALANRVADFARVLQLDLHYNILVQRCPVSVSIDEITVSFFINTKYF